MNDQYGRGRGQGKTTRGGARGGGDSFKWRRPTSIAATPPTVSDAKKLERLQRFASEPTVSRSAGSWRKPQEPTTPQEADLDDFGFVSKGDERLKDLRNQELYHKHITRKYLEFCGTSGTSDQLEFEFAKLAITPLNNPKSTAAASKNIVYNDQRNAELSSILLGMRKLREGITAARRVDKFAIEVFKQHIRAAILVQQKDSYHPALTYLLYELHSYMPLSTLDIQEFGSYHMLHLAACMEEYGAALAVKNEFQIADQRALQALNGLIHGNYWSYRAARNRVDQYMGRLMDYAEDRMRKLALKSIGAAYFTVNLPYLEAVSGLPWEKLQEEYSVGWELDRAQGMVTVKRPKMKTKPAPMMSTGTSV
ncbi:hypothetical protein FPQ18DRAFT_316698 [Pyronema domesticum]|nr:hypothetical protein FPQ18DRAFT_316698 [Pyronema domesticum]